MRWVVVVFGLTACRFNFFEKTSTTDAPQPSGDALPDSLGLDSIPMGPFGTPATVANINDPTYTDDDPALTEDMLEIYFDSDRPAGAAAAMGDIFVSTRTSTVAPWSTPTLVTELASTSDDSTPDLSPDGLTMYFGSDRLSAGNRDLFVTTRPDRASPWSVPQRIAELATTQDDSGACQSADGLTLIFQSARSGSGDLFITTRASTSDPWSPPVVVPGLDSPMEESQHWCNRDLTVIYFSRYNGSNHDIWMTSRPNPSSAFAPAVEVSELTTIYDDADPWLSPDLRTMYFFSRKSGNGDIFVTTR
ncbi:MAG TPA: hypothetical protein VLB44_24195 [Kofleriaceae bacterium]|nr:hypothetical protein [Kofleriaceae bacterium]